MRCADPICRGRSPQLDNNRPERLLRGIAISRRDLLFLGSDRGEDPLIAANRSAPTVRSRRAELAGGVRHPGRLGVPAHHPRRHLGPEPLSAEALRLILKARAAAAGYDLARITARASVHDATS
jgi:hypothetical protein